MDTTDQSQCTVTQSRDAIMQRTGDATDAITADSSHDDVCLAIQYRDALKEATRLLCERVDAAVMEWIRVHGDVTIGPVRYYIGQSTTTKCRSVPDTLRAVLETTGGDVDAVAQLLSASAFKPGACKKTLPPEVYDAHFETRAVEDVKTGVPKPPRLQEFDERFVR